MSSELPQLAWHQRPVNEALPLILEKYHGLAVRIAGPGLAADVMQEAALRIMRTWSSIQKHPNPTAYVCSTIRSCAIDLLRAESRHRQLADASRLEPGVTLATPGSAAQEAELQLAEKHCLEDWPDCVGSLPDKLRQVYQLAWNGWGFQQIAERLGVSYNAAYGRLLRAHEQVVQCLRQKGHGRGWYES